MVEGYRKKRYFQLTYFDQPPKCFFLVVFGWEETWFPISLPVISGDNHTPTLLVGIKAAVS